MWIDTHIHLDASEFEGQQAGLLSSAKAAGVGQWVIPSVMPSNFQTVRDMAHAHLGCTYALGIHPMYVDRCDDQAIELLEAALSAHASDPKLVAVGEIGLDYFVPNQNLERQQRFFKAQLKLAQRYELPVILHVRRSQDHVAKYLRQHPVCGGIAHAFNGSAEQAKVFTDMGLCLGFGGAATYTRALQIRRLLHSVDDTSIVLETDAPDIPPEWLAGQNNVLQALARIGHELAHLRGMAAADFAAMCQRNSYRALPRLALACTPPRPDQHTKM